MYIMSLIKPKPLDEDKTQFRVRLKSNICQEIQQYCEWSGIKYRDYFIEQACTYVFSQDKEWQKHINKKFQNSDQEDT